MGRTSLFLISYALLVPCALQQNALRGSETRHWHLKEEEGVIVLTQRNFEELTKSQPIMLVEFFAPWCGHCRHFAPTYAAIARKLKTTRPSVACGKVDVTVERQLADQHHIKSFPTVKVLYDGEDNDEVYDGWRTEDAIIKFALDRAGPFATAVSSIADVEKFRSNQSAIILGFFKRHHKVWSDEAGMVFKQVSRKVEQATFAYTFEAAVWERYNLTTPAVVAFPSANETAMVYGGSMTSEQEMEAFAKASVLPPVVRLAHVQLPTLLHDGRPLLLLFRDTSAEGQSAENAFHAAIPSAARRLLGVLVELGSVGKSTDAAWLKETAALDEDDETLSVCILQDPEGLNQIFRLEGDISAESISGFINDYFANKLHPLPQELSHRDET